MGLASDADKIGKEVRDKLDAQKAAKEAGKAARSASDTAPKNEGLL